MAFAPRTLPTGTTELQELVKPGQVLNGLTCSAVPRGLPYMVKFGNNAESGPYTGKVTWTIGSGTPERDVSEGVYVRCLFAVPTGAITFQVGFKSATTST